MGRHCRKYVENFPTGPLRFRMDPTVKQSACHLQKYSNRLDSPGSWEKLLERSVRMLASKLHRVLDSIEVYINKSPGPHQGVRLQPNDVFLVNCPAPEKQAPGVRRHIYHVRRLPFPVLDLPGKDNPCHTVPGWLWDPPGDAKQQWGGRDDPRLLAGGGTPPWRERQRAHPGEIQVTRTRPPSRAEGGPQGRAPGQPTRLETS